jgi:hypothetical protein
MKSQKEHKEFEGIQSDTSQLYCLEYKLLEKYPKSAEQRNNKKGQKCV